LFADPGSGGQLQHDGDTGAGGDGESEAEELSETEDPGLLMRQIQQEAAGNTVVSRFSG
jgi:hypothetical protein